MPKNFGVSEKYFDIEQQSNTKTLDIRFFFKFQIFEIMIIVAKYG